MKAKLIVLFVMVMILSAPLFLCAEEPQPKKILVPGDVERFVKTFPLLKEDFEKYGAKYEAKSGNITIPEALSASSEYMAVLKKHGWDEQFFLKMTTIFSAYASIVYKKEMKAQGPQIAEALKQIESNPQLSADMKKQLVSQMKQTMGAIEQGSGLFGGLHPEDVALVTPFVDQLKAVMDEGKEKRKRKRQGN